MKQRLTAAALLTALLSSCAMKNPDVISYQDPEPLAGQRSGKAAEFTLTAQKSRLDLAGQSVEALTYNGTFPGPLLTLKAGEDVRITLKNNLSEPTNLHLHGLPLSPEVDDPFVVVPPGGSHTYAFQVPEEVHGTFWYHTHTHGASAAQLFSGLAGPLLVEAAKPNNPIEHMETHTVVFKDLPGAQHADDGVLMNGRENTLLVNGLVSPTLKTENSWVQLRLINASNARYLRLKLDDGLLQVVARDGIDLPGMERAQELLLTPGERADVLVSLQDHQNLKLQNLPYDRGVHSMGSHSGHTESKTAVVLTLQGPQKPGASVPRVETAPPPFLQLQGNEKVRKVILQETMQPVKFFINGRSFDMNRVDFHVSEGSTEIWELQNTTEMDHPFHLHTFPMQLIRIGGKEVPPVWKDTVNIPKNSTVTVAVHFKGFTGKTVFHCHIAEHEEAGMMGLLQVHPSGTALPASLEPIEPTVGPGEDAQHGH
ncbi:multicopper oxidase family protein [Deinococcus cellulosilyticus]|uniref:Multicopper oxidase n=2 Tax=Deinococcus cellulosilyticus TaxID=401558 RepID=A0A511N1L0_DEIC1